MISFVEPLFLLILLVLPLLWLLAFAARRSTIVRPQRATFWISLLLPTAAVIALTGALAGTQISVPDRTQTVIFVLDRSASLAPAAREQAELYLRDSLSALPIGDRAGVVVFGERAVVARLPGEERTLDPLPVVSDDGRTNISAALQLALALLPSEGRRRLVLLSDGNENMGDVSETGQIAAASGVALDVVPLASGVDGFDAQISALDLPSRARQGQNLRLTVQTTAPQSAPARLIVSSNGIPLVETELQLAAGRSEQEIELPEPSVGFHRYSVQLEVAGDVRTQNNRAETFTTVSGPPRVLIIASTPEASDTLQAALTAASITTEVILPAALPTSLGALSNYDAIVLANVEWSALPTAADALLPAYVRDLGRGLAMIGGSRSLGAGGYRDSAIEAALPVTMDPRPNLQSPPAAIVVLMDVSGSMATYEGEATKLQLAAAGATRLAEQLRDEDSLTIIPFDRMAMGIIGPLPGNERATIPDRLKGLAPGSGGINLFDGLQVAKRYLSRAEQKVRHLIVLTDGDDTAQKEGAEDTVRGLNADGVTVTMLAVGRGKDVSFVEQLARLGGGRFFLARNASTLPSIMTDEAQLVLRPYLIEGAFQPITTPAGRDAAILREIGDLPTLNGYVASQAKERASVLLKAANDDPLLATWQYGLGRSLVWTSDTTGQWSSALVQSPQFPRLAAQIVSWLLPPSGGEQLTLAAQPQGDALLLTVTTVNTEGRPIGGLHMVGQLFPSNGSGRAISLREISPGTYGTVVQDLEAGSYAVELVATDADGVQVASTTGGALLTNGSEYQDQQTNTPLLQAIAARTGGRVAPQPATIYDAPVITRGRPIELARPLLIAALILLPLTVVARRLRFGRGALPRGAASRGELSVPDRAWFLLFGDTPFHEEHQRQKQRRSEQQAWANWVHEQAQQVRSATDRETSDHQR